MQPTRTQNATSHLTESSNCLKPMNYNYRFETVTRLHRFRRLVMVGKPQLYTYNLFNLFVVKGLLEFILHLSLTRTISTLSIPKFSLSTFQPLDLSSSRGCKSSSPQHLPSNWETLWYEVAFFSGSVHCFFVSAL